jgi:hypothetical protein
MIQLVCRHFRIFYFISSCHRNWYSQLDYHAEFIYNVDIYIFRIHNSITIKSSNRVLQWFIHFKSMLRRGMRSKLAWSPREQRLYIAIAIARTSEKFKITWRRKSLRWLYCFDTSVVLFRGYWKLWLSWIYVIWVLFVLVIRTNEYP